MAGTSADPPNAYVRLTAPAFDDLESLLKKDPQIVRWALKKMLLLERDPQAGDPLLGALVGWRKLTVGDRDWRIVWRVTTDESGVVTITIAEVWAIGARSEAEVYQEMNSRVAAAEASPSTMALAEVIELIGRHANRSDLSASFEPRADPVPDWLRDRLIHTAGLEAHEVEAMTGAQAMERWEQYMTRGE
jgi:mRNA interferase RelE/StbE